MKKQKTNRYAKKVMTMVAAGHSVESIVEWYQRMVYNAEIVNGVAVFWLAESVPDGNNCYRFTGKSIKILEIPAN